MECCLGKGELMRLSGGAEGLVLFCLKGTIWLTTGDGRDYLVRQGSSFELKEGDQALAEALGSADIRLRAIVGERSSVASIALKQEWRSC